MILHMTGTIIDSNIMIDTDTVFSIAKISYIKEIAELEIRVYEIVISFKSDKKDKLIITYFDKASADAAFNCYLYAVNKEQQKNGDAV